MKKEGFYNAYPNIEGAPSTTPGFFTPVDEMLGFVEKTLSLPSIGTTTEVFGIVSVPEYGGGRNPSTLVDNCHAIGAVR